jgi:hypothetical protein
MLRKCAINVFENIVATCIRGLSTQVQKIIILTHYLLLQSGSHKRPCQPTVLWWGTLGQPGQEQLRIGLEKILKTDLGKVCENNLV